MSKKEEEADPRNIPMNIGGDPLTEWIDGHKLDIFKWIKKSKEKHDLEDSIPEVYIAPPKNRKEMFDDSVKEVYLKNTTSYIGVILENMVYGEEAIKQTEEAGKLYDKLYHEMMLAKARNLAELTKARNQEELVSLVKEKYPEALWTYSHNSPCPGFSLTLGQVKEKLAELAIEQWEE